MFHYFNIIFVTPKIKQSLPKIRKKRVCKAIIMLYITTIFYDYLCDWEIAT